MGKTEFVKNLIKIIALFVLDAITLRLVFSVWVLLNISLFSWAFCAIIFSLLLVNILVLVSKKFIEFFGVGVYASSIICTLFYYIFIMLFTGATYVWITQRGYILVMLTATLVYVLVAAGLYLAGVNKNKDIVRHEKDQENVLNVTSQLMTMIDQNIKSYCDGIEQTSYVTVMKEAFADMSERLQASTPFGRINKIVVLDMETKINSQLFIINDNVVLLNTKSDNQKTCEFVTSLLIEVKALIMNREKLIIQ